MYTYSEDGGYTFTDIAEIHQYSSQTTTFQKSITTTELQWECTADGYSLVQASDLLFKGDSVNTAVKVASQPEEEREDRQCQTWYVPSKPVERASASRSAEYVAPHKRFYGYDRTPRRTISSSGETTRDAHSRSNSRQSQKHLQTTPNHRRSVSRSSYRSNPAPVVSRERAQPRAHLMPVVNLTRRTNTRRRTNNQNSQENQPRNPDGSFGQICSEVPRARKIKGKWYTGGAEPKPTKVCFQFEKNGCCSWGARCRFAHVVKKKNTYQVDRKRYNPQPKNYDDTSSSRATSVARNRFDFRGDDGAAW